MAQEDGPDIQIFYGLHDGPPFLMGAGSFDDGQRIIAEVDAIEADPSSQPGDSTRHFYTELGKTGHVEPLTEGALDHYSLLAQRARDGWIKKLREPDSAE